MANNKITRAFLGLPILSFTVGCIIFMGREDALLHLERILPTGRVSWDSIDIPIVQSFYGVNFLDKIFRGVSVAFGPAAFGVDPVAWYQVFSFLLDVSLLYNIWPIESYKPVNLWTPSYLPVLFGLPMQVLSAGVVAPIYFYLHYITSASDTVRQPRLHNLDAPSNKFVILTMSIFSYIPIFMMYCGNTTSIRYWWIWFWQLFPVWSELSQIGLPYITASNADHRKNARAAQVAVKIFAVVSGVAWIYVNLWSPYSPMTLYYLRAVEQPTFPQAMRICSS